MNTDVNFAVWCARRCVHLWDPSEEVKSWLADPNPARAAGAAGAAARAAARAADAAGATAGATAGAAWAAAEAAAWAARAAGAADAAGATAGATAGAAWAAATCTALAARAAAQVLYTTVGQLRLDYVATWSDDELARASGDWIDPATVEIFERAAKSRRRQ